MTDAGIALLKQFEGFVGHPYYDAGGVQTIGYGTTIPLNEAEADLLLRSRIADFEPDFYHLVTVPLTANQHDALVCLVYNIGVHAFETSHLRFLINTVAPNAEVLVEWMKWDHVGRRVNAGLENRRKAEMKLWETPNDVPAVPAD